MSDNTFVYADGAAEKFRREPGDMVTRVAFTVEIEINLNAYADEYGDEPSDQRLPDDVVESALNNLVHSVPSHLAEAFLLGVREDSRTFPRIVRKP